MYLKHVIVTGLHKGTKDLTVQVIYYMISSETQIPKSAPTAMSIPPLSFRKKDLAAYKGSWDQYCSLRHEQKKTKVRWVDIRTGKGLFAAEFIPKGTPIIEYTGLSLDMCCVEELSDDRFNFDKDQEEYIVKTYSGKLSIDAGLSNADNVAKYINHGCNPNAKYYTIDLAENDKNQNEPVEVVFVYPIRNISKGEEIRTCYDWERSKSRQKCECASINCSDLIGVRGYPLVTEEVIDGEGPSGEPIGKMTVFETLVG